jgi:hypothetical protein
VGGGAIVPKGTGLEASAADEKQQPAAEVAPWLSDVITWAMSRMAAIRGFAQAIVEPYGGMISAKALPVAQCFT